MARVHKEENASGKKVPFSLASGKRLRNELERSTMLKMDLPTISMVIFNSYASLNLLII